MTNIPKTLFGYSWESAPLDIPGGVVPGVRRPVRSQKKSVRRQKAGVRRPDTHA